MLHTHMATQFWGLHVDGVLHSIQSSKCLGLILSVIQVLLLIWLSCSWADSLASSDTRGLCIALWWVSKRWSVIVSPNVSTVRNRKFWKSSRFQATCYPIWFLVDVALLVEIVSRFVSLELIVESLLGMTLCFLGNTRIVESAVREIY